MVTKNEFNDLVSSAYQGLYDFVRLRSHPLTDLLLADEAAEFKERGWQMHRVLLNAIEQLYPGPTAPPFSKEWRRHRLMVLRYVEALDPQAVADQLAISRRQYYREHTVALEGLADLLWAQCQAAIQAATDIAARPTEDAVAVEASAEEQQIEHDAAHADVMQRELVRISQDDAYAHLPEVIEGVLDVTQRVLEQHRIMVQLDLPGEIPVVSISHRLLRQVLLGALGFLTEYVTPARLNISAEIDDSAVIVRLIAEDITPPPADHDPHARLGYLRDMLKVGNASIRLLSEGTRLLGFALDLPLDYDWTVLAVDDNEDTLALYSRCLQPNRYRVLTTNSAHEVLPLARRIQPDVIMLDLMMPEHDGWDLLQQLTNQPDTAHIPIMICSVLKQRELALSLGAVAYLAKPFTEQELLNRLNALLTSFAE